MTASALMAEASALGINLVVVGDRLRVEAPAGVLTEALRVALADLKPAVLAILAQDLDASAAESAAERAAIVAVDEAPASVAAVSLGPSLPGWWRSSLAGWPEPWHTRWSGLAGRIEASGRPRELAEAMAYADLEPRLRAEDAAGFDGRELVRFPRRAELG